MQEEDEEVANMRRIKRWTVMGMLWALLGLLVVAQEASQAEGVTTATGSITFQRIYGGSDWDRAYAVAGPLDDGGFLLVGETWSFGAGGYDMYAVRTDRSGTVLWSKTYGGSGDDYANDVIALADGGFLLVGRTGSFGAGSSDMYAVRIDKDGNVLWSKTYGGSDWEGANAVAGPLADGGFLLVGRTYGGYDMYAVRTDRSGTVLWSKTYGGSGDDYANDVIALADGGFLLVGRTDSFGAGGDDMYAVRIDQDGNVKWSKTYGGSFYEDANAVAGPLADGGFLLVGKTWSFGTGRDDMYAVRIDKDGYVLWSKTYGESRGDQANAVAGPLDDGGFLLVGKTYRGAREDEMYTVRIDKDGNVVWSKIYGRSDDDRAYDVIALPDGGFLLVGWTDIGPGENMYAVRIDSLGASGCQETSSTTQTTAAATQETDPSTQVMTSTATVTSPTPQTSVPNTGTHTMCLLVPTWQLHLPLVVREG